MGIGYIGHEDNLKEKHIGSVFGKLSILEVYKGKNGKYRFKSKCDCGNIHDSLITETLSGKSKSCKVCSSNKRYIESGMSNSGFKSEGRIYVNMIARCYKKNHKNYKDYGGRGITVSEEWRLSKHTFLNDMGARPTKRHSLDRIDNNLGYSKDNCKWSTYEEQNNNRRDTVFLTAFGKTQGITEWARELNMNRQCIRYRLKIGKSHEECLKVKNKLVKEAEYEPTSK